MLGWKASQAVLRRSVVTQSIRTNQQSAYDKVIFARNRKFSSSEKKDILFSKIAFLAAVGIFGVLTIRGYYNPWDIERYEGKLINYQPERYVQQRENFNA